jgi:hypothetical protein
MPTFLTSSKMDPELIARIEASVRRQSRDGTKNRRRYAALTRLVLWTLVLLLVVAGFALGLW